MVKDIDHSLENKIIHTKISCVKIFCSYTYTCMFHLHIFKGVGQASKLCCVSGYHAPLGLCVFVFFVALGWLYHCGCQQRKLVTDQEFSLVRVMYR